MVSKVEIECWTNQPRGTIGEMLHRLLFFGGDNVKSEKEIPIRNVEIPFGIQGKVK